MRSVDDALDKQCWIEKLLMVKASFISVIDLNDQMEQEHRTPSKKDVANIPMLDRYTIYNEDYVH